MNGSSIEMKNNSTIKGFYYAINVTALNDNLSISIVDSKIDSWAALNIWSSNNKFKIANSTLESHNYQLKGSNDFATIVLNKEHFGDREFFVFRNAAAAAPCDTTHLLPAYDQYLIGYKDRSDVLAKEHTSKAFNSHGIFQPVILCDGQIVGNWKRTAGRGNVTIQTTLWVDTVPEALDAAIARYRSFIGGTKSENSPEAL